MFVDIRFSFSGTLEQNQENPARKWLSLLCTYDDLYVNLLRELQKNPTRNIGRRPVEPVKVEGDQYPAPQNGFLQFTVNNL